MKLKFTVVAITFLALTSLKAQEISDTSFGKGLINFVAKDSSFSVKFAPRFQVGSRRTAFRSSQNGGLFGAFASADACGSPAVRHTSGIPVRSRWRHRRYTCDKRGSDSGGSRQD